jgi:hypothetical protein
MDQGYGRVGRLDSRRKKSKKRVAFGKDGEKQGTASNKGADFKTSLRGTVTRNVLTRIMSRGGMKKSAFHVLGKSLLMLLQGMNERFP